MHAEMARVSKWHACRKGINPSKRAREEKRERDSRIDDRRRELRRDYVQNNEH
jgi:hypothetical protein